jgi:hypothetical protein
MLLFVFIDNGRMISIFKCVRLLKGMINLELGELLIDKVSMLVVVIQRVLTPTFGVTYHIYILLI